MCWERVLAQLALLARVVHMMAIRPQCMMTIPQCMMTIHVPCLTCVSYLRAHLSCDPSNQAGRK
jgi:hypothetical protein